MGASLRNNGLALKAKVLSHSLWSSSLVGLVAFVSTAQTLQNNFAVTNGSVTAVVQSGNTIYLGGQFTYAGPNTGRGAEVDTVTGTYVSGFPDINGTVYAVASDSIGGWYVGGNFSAVGGVARNSIAHIKSDKSVDSWNPNVKNSGSNGTVYTIVKCGSLLYVGGAFDTIGTTKRTNLAAIDSATGIVNSWNPGPGGTVYGVVVTPTLTFFGGAFGATLALDTVNKTTVRNRLAATYTNSNVLALWNPGATGGTAVFGMLLKDTILYCWGDFTSLDGSARYSVGSLYLTNTSTAGALHTPWNPNRVTSIYAKKAYALAVSGDTVFVGGTFTKFGSSTTTRNKIAAVNISGSSGTGTVLAWDPNIAAATANESTDPTCVRSFIASGNTVYVAGYFVQIGSNMVNYLAAIGRSTGTTTSWTPNASARAYALAPFGSTIYCGGSFTSVNGQTRNALAAFDKTTGNVMAWNPNAGAGGAVNGMAISGNTVYAAGSFTAIGATSRANLAAIDASTGNATSWQCNVNGSVQCMGIGGSKLYVGGTITAVGGAGTGDSVRHYIAAVDTGTGAVSAWNPNADGTVYSLLASGSTVYAGGSFGIIGGKARSCIAALDATTGIATSWNPNASNIVKSLALSGTTLYAGGTFASIGGATHNYIVAISTADTGTATSWNPNITGSGSPEVDAIVVNGSTIYAGGVFAAVGATTRANAVAIDASTGNATTWNPSSDAGVDALSVDVTNHKIYLGGSFSNVLNQTASSFAAVDNPGDAALPVELVSLTGTVSNQSNVELHWKTATETDNYGFDVERRPVSNSQWTKVGFVHGAGTSASMHDYAFSDHQLPAGRYGYRIRQIDNAGSSKYTQTIEVEVGSVPQQFALLQNYPNPFNPSTTIQYAIPTTARVVLKIYNLLGQEVETLVDAQQTVGQYRVSFDGATHASGIYYYQLQSGGNVQAKTMMLLK